MSGTGYFNQGKGFERVSAYTSGGYDQAFLYDSSGNDTLSSTATSARLTVNATGLFIEIFGFDYARARSTSGTDTAQKHPSATWLFLEGPWVT